MPLTMQELLAASEPDDEGFDHEPGELLDEHGQRELVERIAANANSYGMVQNIQPLETTVVRQDAGLVTNEDEDDVPVINWDAELAKK